jgi:uridylate kinase
MKNPSAKRYRTLSFSDAISLPGVEVMDTAALAMSQENNMPIMVFKLFEENNLEKAVLGEDIGTFVGNDVKTEFAE